MCNIRLWLKTFCTLKYCAVKDAQLASLKLVANGFRALANKKMTRISVAKVTVCRGNLSKTQWC